MQEITRLMVWTTYIYGNYSWGLLSNALKRRWLWPRGREREGAFFLFRIWLFRRTCLARLCGLTVLGHIPKSSAQFRFVPLCSLFSLSLSLRSNWAELFNLYSITLTSSCFFFFTLCFRFWVSCGRSILFIIITMITQHYDYIPL